MRIATPWLGAAFQSAAPRVGNSYAAAGSTAGIRAPRPRFPPLHDPSTPIELAPPVAGGVGRHRGYDGGGLAERGARRGHVCRRRSRERGSGFSGGDGVLARPWPDRALEHDRVGGAGQGRRRSRRLGRRAVSVRRTLGPRVLCIEPKAPVPSDAAGRRAAPRALRVSVVRPGSSVRALRTRARTGDSDAFFLSTTDCYGYARILCILRACS